MKNARENVECSVKDLQGVKSKLEEALTTVEKASNKENIQNSLNAVENALNTTEQTIQNYQER